MAGNAGLKLTAWVDDKASVPLRAIGQEAKRMGEGFSKASGALRLVESAAHSMGGQVAEAAGKISGLAGIVASGGVFGIALASATAAGLAFSKVLDVIADNADKALESSEHFKKAAAIEAVDKAERDRAKKLQDDLRATLAGIDQERSARLKMEASVERIRKAGDAWAEKQKKRETERIKILEEQAGRERLAAEHRHDLFVMHGEARLAASDVEFELAIQRAEELDEKQKELAEERVEREQAVGQAIGSVANNLVNIALAGNEKERQAAISSALDQVQAYAVEGASGAAASAAESLPFPASVIVPPIVGALVYGAILALRNKIGYQHGGYTGDGPSNEVAGVVHRGEYVVPAPIVQEVRRGMSNSGGGITVVNNFKSVMPPNSIETRRAVREIEKHARMVRTRRGAA